tara:strand:- start:185 stop:505 length:321 start_codon:yes stop_codon:yes gene_type:complete
MFEVAIAVLSVCAIIITYHIVKFLKFSKSQSIKRDYGLRRYQELQQTKEFENERLKNKIKELKQKKEDNINDNIFRQMAIEQIASQKLIYDEESGKYVRRRQIKLD